MVKDIKIVIIGGSAGSFNVVRKLLSSIPGDFNLPIILCLHRLKDIRFGFAESLRISSNIPVIEPEDKEILKGGIAYLCPSNYHTLIEPGGRISLSTEPDINYSRPSIDLTFESGGFAFRNQMAGIILSGTNSDGAKGLFSSYQRGALTIVQDPECAQFNTMPNAALSFFTPEKVLTVDRIIDFIYSLKSNGHV